MDVLLFVYGMIIGLIIMFLFEHIFFGRAVSKLPIMLGSLSPLLFSGYLSHRSVYFYDKYLSPISDWQFYTIIFLISIFSMAIGINRLSPTFYRRLKNAKSTKRYNRNNRSHNSS